MAESWVRLWAGMTLNAKWQTIARKSGQRRSLVIAMFTHLLMIANEAEPRGSVASADIEDIASALDEDEEAIRAIWDVFLGRAIDPETLRLTGWEKHQPTREDAIAPTAKTATERKRDQRERERASRDVTRCHAMSRDVTHGHAPEADTEAEADTGVLKRASTTEPEVAREDADRSRASPTAAGEVCRQLREANVPSVNPSHPKLQALLEAGLTADEIVGIAREPQSAGKGFAWILAAAEGRRRDAAAVRPLPRASPPTSSHDRLQVSNRRAIEQAKEKILAAEAARANRQGEDVIDAN